jgi:hypothetical protein
MNRALELADLQALAILPFEVLDALGLPAQYERSFKMRPGDLDAQRFLLGVPVAGVSNASLVEASRRLGMPTGVRAHFEQALVGASMVLYGFEGGLDTAILKAYVEYRTRLGPTQAVVRDPEGRAMPVELFRGFKWHAIAALAARAESRASSKVGAADTASCVQTVYYAIPGLISLELSREIKLRLRERPFDSVRAAVLGIVERACKARPDFTPLWLDLGEADRPMRAFDINLYDAGLRVQEIGDHLMTLAQALRIEPSLVHRLLAAAGPGLLGHVSTGCGRDGLPYLTVYFEPVAPTG